jgi:uncharacterized protein (DUF302 family)
MEKHPIPTAPDFTTGSAFIKGESTLAVVSVDTFEQLAGRLEAALTRHSLEVLHVHDMDALLCARGVGVDFHCRVYEVWNATLASRLLRFDADVGHVMPCRITLHDQGGVATVVAPQPRVAMGEFSHAAEVARIARRFEELMQQVLRELG